MSPIAIILLLCSLLGCTNVTEPENELIAGVTRQYKGSPLTEFGPDTSYKINDTTSYFIRTTGWLPINFGVWSGGFILDDTLLSYTNVAIGAQEAWHELEVYVSVFKPSGVRFFAEDLGFFVGNTPDTVVDYCLLTTTEDSVITHYTETVTVYTSDGLPFKNSSRPNGCKFTVYVEWINQWRFGGSSYMSKIFLHKE